MQFALIAGGSKGIGLSIAHALAKRNYNLALVADNFDSLKDARDRLISDYEIEVEILVLDLSNQSAAKEVSNWCSELKFPISVFCNVAGLGGVKDYLLLTEEDVRTMVSLNVTSPLGLILNLLPILEKNAPSFILNVGSMAGFAPIPDKNIYSMTKAALLFFSFSLRQQLKHRNISVSCLCPGPVFTKTSIKKQTLAKLGNFGKLMAVTSDKVGEIAIRNTLKGKLVIIPGAIAGSVSFFLRLCPHRITSYLYKKLE